MTIALARVQAQVLTVATREMMNGSVGQMTEPIARFLVHLAQAHIGVNAMEMAIVKKPAMEQVAQFLMVRMVIVPRIVK